MRRHVVARGVRFPVELELHLPDRATIRFLRRGEVPAPLLGLLLSHRRLLSFLLGVSLMLIASRLIGSTFLKWLNTPETAWLAPFIICAFMLFGSLLVVLYVAPYVQGGRDDPGTLNGVGSFLADCIGMAFLVFILEWYRGFPGAHHSLDVAFVNAALAVVCAGASRAPFYRLKNAVSHLGCHKTSRQDFAIGFFRSFDGAYSRFALYELAPQLAAYGRLVYLADVVFSDLSSTNAQDVDLAFNPQSTDQSWRHDFLSRLLTVDLAVFDISRPSMNIDWEFSRALTYLGPSRIVLVAHRDADVTKYHERLWSNLPHGHTAPAVLRYGSGSLRSWLFRVALYQRMRALSIPGALEAGGQEPTIVLPCQKLATGALLVDGSTLASGLRLSVTPAMLKLLEK